MPRPVKLDLTSESWTDVLSGLLDTVHGLVHPRLGQPLTLHPDLILLGAPEEGVEVTHFLVHVPP
ncbi:MAG: hypothetical protein ACK53Y_12215, partial [bacterium]